MTPALFYFGTDGIRGEVNAHPMTVDFFLRLGKAVGIWLTKGSESTPREVNPTRKPVVFIARDTRQSGGMFECAFSAGLHVAGVDTWHAGVLPTPAVSVLLTRYQLDFGAIISASHNPARDNGIKFVGSDGGKLPIDCEQEIEALMEDPSLDSFIPNHSKSQVGVPMQGRDLGLDFFEDYVQWALGTVEHLNLNGLKIVVDAAHGSAYHTTSHVLRKLGAEVILVGASPDGLNINEGVGCLNLGFLSNHVLEHGAHLGLAHDGDADRVLFCDELGQPLDGDDFMAIVSSFLLEKNELPERKVVGTVMCNAGLEAYLQDIGVELLRAQVGDKNVVGKMREAEVTFGGEQSGHLVFSRFAKTGDGLLASLQLLRGLKEKGKPLSSLRNVWKRFPQRQTSLRVLEREPLENLPGFESALSDLQEALGPKGRHVIRYSGTELLLRILLEGPEEEVLDAAMVKLVSILKADLHDLSALDETHEN